MTWINTLAELPELDRLAVTAGLDPATVSALAYDWPAWRGSSTERRFHLADAGIGLAYRSPYGTPRVKTQILPNRQFLPPLGSGKQTETS